MLRLVTEEVTWTNDGHAGPEVTQWRREMLASLTASLDITLPFLHTALEMSYSKALEAGQAGNSTAARLHAATVTAALSAHLCRILRSFSDSTLSSLLNHLQNHLRGMQPACKHWVAISK